MEHEERLAAKAWEKQQAAKQKKKATKMVSSIKKRGKIKLELTKDKKDLVNEQTPRRLKRRLSYDDLMPAKFIGSYDDVAELPRLGLPEIAFLGRSNVGKSSLLNALLAERKPLAIVGQRPGRTRRINLFDVNDRRGARCIFADLPGYGYAKLSKTEQEAIGEFVMGYLDARPQLQLIIFIVDSRREPNPEDIQLLDRLRRINGLETIVVATKIDKLTSGDLLLDTLNALNIAFDLPHDQPLYFSAITRQGRSDLWATINDYIGPSPHHTASPLGATRSTELNNDVEDEFLFYSGTPPSVEEASAEEKILVYSNQDQVDGEYPLSSTERSEEQGDDDEVLSF